MADGVLLDSRLQLRATAGIPGRVSLQGNRLSLGVLAISLHGTAEAVHTSVRRLLDRGYLSQDRRDTVDWDHAHATFFTHPAKRDAIDCLIRNDASSTP